MTGPDGDDRLMEEIASGGREALRGLIARHGGGLIRFLARMTGDATAAEDLAQETFLRVLRHANRYRPGVGFRAWLYAIARRLALNHLGRGFRKGNGWPAEIPVAAPDPLERIELQAAIDRALEAIDEPFRSALLLVVVEELSYEEAARACDCPVKTLSSRLARGRERFRELMSPYLVDGVSVRREAKR